MPQNLCATCDHLEEEHPAADRGEYPCSQKGCECTHFEERDDYESPWDRLEDVEYDLDESA